MSKAIMYSLLALLVCSPFPAAAAGSRPVEAWSYYHFNGSSFAPGPATDGTPYVAVREKMRPVVVAAPTSPLEQTALPDDAGVIAGICYLQSYGGKLAPGSGFKPYARVPLLISSGGKPLVTVQTDDHGYFMVILAAGTYTVGNGPATSEIAVERGITTLVPLRAGKRMVD